MFDQIFGQGFDQGFEEGKNHKHSVQYYPAEGKKRLTPLTPSLTPLKGRTLLTGAGY